LTAVALATAALLTVPAAASADLNHDRWDGGDTVTALAGPHGCNYTHFCLYRNANYTEKVFDRVNCGRYDTRQIYFTSYVNNQTRGTRAQFLDYLGNRLSYTKPAPDKGTTSLGLRTAYVVPC
jgi:hypothetical protein